MGACFSVLATALLLSTCLAVAGVAACAPRITAPVAEVAAGAVEWAGYRFLRWRQGLAIMIWYDFRGDSGSSSTSSGGGLGTLSTYTIHGYAESEDGDRFEWEVETSDGETARFRLDGESYDLSRGTLFIVRMEHGRADIIQLERDLSGVEPNHASIVAFARGDADLAPLDGAAPPPTPESPVPTPLSDASTCRNGECGQITRSSTSSDRRTLEEAEEMIRQHLWTRRPFFRRDLNIPIRELPVSDTISLLPPSSSSEVMRARVAYVDFHDGTGVRFLTQYATPDLSLLDAMIQSLGGERPWMGDLPASSGN
jgi:hypothetical protein